MCVCVCVREGLRNIRTDFDTTVRSFCQKTWESTVENGQKAKHIRKSSFSFMKSANCRISQCTPIGQGNPLHRQTAKTSTDHKWPNVTSQEWVSSWIWMFSQPCSDTSGRGLLKSECWGAHLWAQSRGPHHVIDRLENTDVERGGARHSSLEGQEMATINQTLTHVLSKAKLFCYIESSLSFLLPFFFFFQEAPA